MIATEYEELEREMGDLSVDRIAGQRGFRLLLIAIGVVSLLALGGIVWYAYSQGVREGSEVAAPLLRPDQPAKVKPADPGGRRIAGTDLDVYDRVTGQDGDAARVERILPPPEEPRSPPQPEPAAAGSEEPPTDDGAPVTRALVPAPDLPTPQLAVPEVPPPTAGSETVEAAEAPTELPAAEPAPAPAGPAVTPPPEPPAAAETTQTAGAGWRIQIAAVSSAAAARSEWAKQQKAQPNLLGSLVLEVQQATVSGKLFFRVRGGPLVDAAAAKALCAQLKAANVACIPVAPGK